MRLASLLLMLFTATFTYTLPGPLPGMKRTDGRASSPQWGCAQGQLGKWVPANPRNSKVQTRTFVVSSKQRFDDKPVNADRDHWACQIDQSEVRTNAN